MAYNDPDEKIILGNARDLFKTAKPPATPRKPVVDNGRVNAILDRMRGSVVTQESGGNPRARNQRTDASGLFQVMPANIPVWTKQYLGRPLSQQEFIADPNAQEQVFRGEMGKYVRKALQQAGGDEDKAIRMAAAAWYGGEGAMRRFDDPKRFRANEPSFREYTSSILNRIKKGSGSGKGVTEQQVLAQARDMFRKSGVSAQNNKILQNARALFTGNGDGAGQPPVTSPTVIGGGRVGDAVTQAQMPTQAQQPPQPPVPEAIETIRSQMVSVLDPLSPRAGVLTTTPDQNVLFASQGGFTPVTTPQGTLWVSQAKASALGLNTPQDIAKFVHRDPSAMTRLIGIVENVGDDTGAGVAVEAIDPQTSKEVASAKVTSPQTAAMQQSVNQQMYPNAQNVTVTTDDVVAQRTQGLAPGEADAVMEEERRKANEYLRSIGQPALTRQQFQANVASSQGRGEAAQVQQSGQLDNTPDEAVSGQPKTSAEPRYKDSLIDVNLSQKQGAYYREELNQQVASALSAELEVPFEVALAAVRQEQEGEVFSEAYYEAQAKTRRSHRVQIGGSLKRKAVELNKRVQERESIRRQLTEQYALENTDADSPVIPALKTLRDMGDITQEKYAELADEEQKAYERIRRDFEQGQLKQWAFRQQREKVAPVTQKDIEQAQKDRETYINNLLEEHGSLAKFLKEQKELEEKYKYRPLARPLEFAKAFGSAVPKAVSSILKTGDLLLNLNPIKMGVHLAQGEPISITETGLTTLGDGINRYLESVKNEDFKDDLWVTAFPDALGQVATQIAAGVLTGGASVPTAIGLAMGASEQYDEARRFNANDRDKVIASVIGALAAVPDAILFRRWFKGVSETDRLGFFRKLTDSLLARLGVRYGDKAAQEVVKGALPVVVKNIYISALGEGAQEVSEGKINAVVASLTFDPSEKRKKEIWTWTKEDTVSFLAGMVGGIGGGAVQTKLQQMPERERARVADDLRRELDALIKSGQLEADRAAEAWSLVERFAATRKPKQGVFNVGLPVIIDGKGEGVVVEDRGKTVVVDHAPKVNKDGETTYGKRSIERKDRVTPLVEVEQAETVDVIAPNEVETGISEQPARVEAEGDVSAGVGKEQDVEFRPTRLGDGVTAPESRVARSEAGLRPTMEARQDTLEVVPKEGEKKSEAVTAEPTQSPIVERALTQTVTDIGQLSKQEIAQLNKAVKDGILIKTKNYQYPSPKTMWQVAPPLAKPKATAEQSPAKEQAEQARGEGKTPREQAKESVASYAESLTAMSDAEVKAEVKRTGQDLNAWSNATPNFVRNEQGDVSLNPVLVSAEGREKSERFLAASNEEEFRQSGGNLTQQQYFDRWVNKTIDKSQRAEFLADDAAKSVREQTDRSHKRVIENALKKGRVVSAEILADYPDLAKEFGGEAATKPAEEVPVKEWVNRRIERTATANFVTETDEQTRKRLTSEFSAQHKQAVRNAIISGRTIPPSVLIDYPDLQRDLEEINASSATTKPAEASERAEKGDQAIRKGDTVIHRGKEYTVMFPPNAKGYTMLRDPSTKTGGRLVKSTSVRLINHATPKPEASERAEKEAVKPKRKTAKQKKDGDDAIVLRQSATPASALDEVYNDDGTVNYDKAKNVAERIRSGELEVVRLDRRGEQGRLAGGQRNVEASVILAANEAASERAGSRVKPQERQERVLENYAKREGIWFKPKEFVGQQQGYISKGQEAYVHRADDTSVYKLIDYRAINKRDTPLDFIDNRIALFNHLFPEAPYELAGFMRDGNGTFRFVVKQPFIHSGQYTTAPERARFMQSRGFEMTSRYGEEFATPIYHVRDLHEKNALIGGDGNIYVIDAVPTFNDALLQPFDVRVTGDTDILRQAASLDDMFDPATIEAELAKIEPVREKTSVSDIAKWIEENAESAGYRVIEVSGLSENSFGKSQYIRLEGKDDNGKPFTEEIRVSDHGMGAKRKFYTAVYSLEQAERALFPDRYKKVGYKTNETDKLMLSENEVRPDDEVIRRFTSKKGNPSVEVRRPRSSARWERISGNYPDLPQGRLLAPNGKPSNLPNERIWKMVRTPAFKAWFGDSKVVDENGEPLPIDQSTAFERLSNSRSANAESTADSTKGQPLTLEVDSLLYVPSKSSLTGRSVNTTTSQPTPNRSLSASEQGSYFVRAMPFIPQQQNIIGGKVGTGSVQSKMFSGRENLKIRNRIIRPIVVNVVDVFGGQQRSPQLTFHNDPVLQTLLAINRNGAVTLPPRSGALGDVIALTPTEEAIIPTQLAQSDFQRSQAGSTDNVIFVSHNNTSTALIIRPFTLNVNGEPRGTFAPDDASILRKARDAESAAYLTKTLPKVATPDLMGAVSSAIQPDAMLEVNEEGSEFLRRVFNTIGQGSGEFFGALLPKSILQKASDRIKVYARDMEKAGWTKDDLKPIRDLAKNLGTLAKNPDAIVYVYDDALPEELFHRDDRRSQGVDEQGAKLLEQMIAPFTDARQFRKEYPRLADPQTAKEKDAAISEVVAKLATGQDARYGWDKLPDFKAKRYAIFKTWIDGIIRNNQTEIDRIGAQAFFDRFKYLEGVFSYATNQKGNQSRGQTISPSERSSGGVTDRDRQGNREAGEAEGDQGREAGRESDVGAGRDTESGVRENAEDAAAITVEANIEADKATAEIDGTTVKTVQQKNRKFAVSMARHILDAGEMPYTPESVDNWIAKAEQMLDRPIDDLIRDWDKLPAEISEAEQVTLGGTILKELRDANRLDDYRKFGEKVATSLTEAGRAVRAAALISRFNPDYVVFHADKVARKTRGEALSPTELQKAEQIARDLESANTNRAQTELAEANYKQAIQDADERIKILEDLLTTERAKPKATRSESDLQKALQKAQASRNYYKNLVENKRSAAEGDARSQQQVKELLDEIAAERSDLLATIRSSVRDAKDASKEHTGDILLQRALPTDVGLDPKVLTAYVKVATERLHSDIQNGKPIDAFFKWLDGLSDGTLSEHQQAIIQASAWAMLRPQRVIHDPSPKVTAKRKAYAQHAAAALRVLEEGVRNERKAKQAETREAIAEGQAMRLDRFAKALATNAVARGDSPEVVLIAATRRELKSLPAIKEVFDREYPKATKADFDKFLLQADELYKYTVRELERAVIAARTQRDTISDDELTKIQTQKALATKAQRKAQTAVLDYLAALRRTRLQRYAHTILDIISIPKTLMSTGEVSYALRQGYIPTVLYGKDALEATRKGTITGFKNDVERIVFEEAVRETDGFKRAQKAGVIFSQLGDNPVLDEHFLAGRFFTSMKNAPARWDALGDNIVSRVIKYGAQKIGSAQQKFEHAYTLPGDLQRLQTFILLAQVVDDANLSSVQREQAEKMAAKLANAFTGKTNLKALQSSNLLPKFIQTLGFSPSMVLSRFESGFWLSPLGIALAPAGIRSHLARKTARFYGVMAVLAALFAAAIEPWDDDDDPETAPSKWSIIDPSSKNFLKGRIPFTDVKVDLTANMSEPMKLFFVNAVVSALFAFAGESGRLEDLWKGEREKYIVSDHGDPLRFFRGKLSPSASLALDTFTGKDYIGRRIETVPDFAWAFADRMFPLTYSQAFHAIGTDEATSLMRESYSATRRQQFQNLINGRFALANALLVFSGSAVGGNMQSYTEVQQSRAKQKAWDMYEPMPTKKTEKQRSIESGLRKIYVLIDRRRQAGKDVRVLESRVNQLIEQYQIDAKTARNIRMQAADSSFKFITQRLSAAQVKLLLDEYATASEKAELEQIYKKKARKERVQD